MIDNIAILISGNPVSSSGVKGIGGIGTGLVSIDPEWPSRVQGDIALVITEKGQLSNYCLMLTSKLISSSDGNRTGTLNIQLQIPFGKVLADAEGNKVSPFTLLEKVFNHYKQHHLTQYPGVEGWNYATDWEMTQAEFDSLLAPYKLIDRVLPNRHLSGTGEAFIAMSPEKMSQFTLDYAYPELVDYGKVILSTVGSTNPPELVRLEIPRRPMFEIYVNGKKQDGLVREGDEAFPMTITPPNPSYQKTATVVVDFNKAAAEGKVDWANECINYTVEFEDLKHDWKVKVILTGLEGESSRDKIMKELLGAVYLESQAAGLYQPADKIKPNGRLANPLEFTLKGKQIISSWEPKWDNLPENVYKDEVKSLYRGFEVTFSYKKPQSNNGRRRDEQNRVDNSKPTVQKKEVEVIPVYITAKDTKDGMLTDIAQGIEFDLTLFTDVKHGDKCLTYHRVRCDSAEGKTQKINSRDYFCYEGKIEVPSAVWDKWMKYTNYAVEVESCDPRYELETELANKKQGNTCIAVYVSKTSKWAMLWHKWGAWLQTLLVLLVLGGCALIGDVVNFRDLLPNSKAVVAPNVPQEVPDPEVSIGDDGHVYINKKIEVTIGENGHWFINGNDMGRTPNNGIPDEKTPTSNAGRDVDDPAPTGSDNVDYTALNAESARYMELIGKAEMSFPQVDEIKKWIDDNRQHRRKIDNYGKIAAAVKDFGKCRDVLMKINAGADIDALCPQIKNVVSTISKDNLLRELRIKMQRFLYEGGKPLKKDEQIIDNIYQFSVKHPDGIRSFKELEDLKEIRVLK